MAVLVEPEQLLAVPVRPEAAADLRTANQRRETAVVLESIPGIKLAYMIAGFAGGVVSLRYTKDLTPGQGFLSVVGGATCANYLTPVFQHFLGMPPALEFGAAFIVGLIALNLAAGIFKRSEKWRDDPTITTKSFTDGDAK
jgi:hypothetical protein